jgi:hypothetical protein
MALKITNEIATSVGMTSEAYLNIESFSYKKSKGVMNIPGVDSDSMSVKVNLYLNKEERLSSPGKTAVSSNVPRYFGFADQESPSPISELKGSANLFEVAYAQIKQYLEDKGLTVVDEL